MKLEVEKLLGFPIPPKLDFILQSGVVRGSTAKEIADLIIRNMPCTK